MKKKDLTQDQVYKILKKFVVDEVHLADFDQGQSLDHTLSVLKNWWNKHKEQFKEENMQQRFTIDEIRKYILSQDSLGDVLYNLKAEKIVEANLDHKINKLNEY
jgi:hypothetical protein